MTAPYFFAGTVHAMMVDIILAYSHPDDGDLVAYALTQHRVHVRAA
jgi:hypothetical protein